MFDEKTDKINYFLKNSLLTDKQQNPPILYPGKNGEDVESFQRIKRIAILADIFVKQGDNLYLYSPNVGNGKTTSAIKIMLSYFNLAWRGAYRCAGLFVSMPRYLVELKANISEKSDYIAHINKYINDADLVIWDDISAYSKNSDFELGAIFNIINNRINAGKSNIFTSNLTPKELENSFGQRLSSRICENSIQIELSGPDRRGEWKKESI